MALCGLAALVREASADELWEAFWLVLEATVVDRFAPHQCQPAPTAAIVSVIKSNHATGALRRRLRNCGAATGGGSCARMPAHSAAGGSWP
ncbi:hypothetical protein GCM10028824_00590 [Hymenobacter segetis]|uniref:Uncharacterized protein n=1 Tax=Hymenobacter segetis TaxID=2025509 RepID=A0ABU9M1K3_9BACT